MQTPQFSVTYPRFAPGDISETAPDIVALTSSFPFAVTNTVRPRLHLDYLDGLRAVAALYVACFHAYLAVYIQSGPSGALRWIGAPMLYGHLSVPVFIVISGFCLMLPITRGDGTLRGGPGQFFAKRAKRILPPYYLAMALILALYVGMKHPLPSGRDVVMHLLLLHNLFPDLIRSKNINPSFWSIAVEWQIYFLFPLLVTGWRRIGGAFTTALAFGLGVIGSCLLATTSLRGLTLHFIGLFTLGMAASALAYGKQGRMTRPISRWCPFCTLGLGAMLVVLCPAWGAKTEFGLQAIALDVVASLFAASLLVTMACAPQRWLTRLFSWKPLVSIGVFSYSFYLLHQPVLHLVLRGIRLLELSADASFVMLLAVGLPAVVAFAALFFQVGERPFTNTRRIS